MQNSTGHILHAIGEEQEFRVFRFRSLAGGSINEVFYLDTSKGEMVLKVNSASRFPGMFPAEKEGLEALGRTNSILAPQVYFFGQKEDTAYLGLEYKPEGPETENFWVRFAEGLASLHQHSREQFGFGSSNYIGSLPQYNSARDSAADFYIDQRLEPQLKMAAERGFSFKDLDQKLKNISSSIPDEAPALIHGDLWSGNYLATSEGPCLIDPAVSYGPREMDLAMMKLFGGYPSSTYRSYHEIFPLQSGFEERIPLWQLYYLLVHLNIFGSSYLPSVEKILNGYR